MLESGVACDFSIWVAWVSSQETRAPAGCPATASDGHGQWSRVPGCYGPEDTDFVCQHLHTYGAVFQLTLARAKARAGENIMWPRLCATLAGKLHQRRWLWQADARNSKRGLRLEVT